MAELSIIIPVYNVEAYLKECVDSVLSQKYTDYEILLIDDGSKDSSGIICDQIQHIDNRIKVFHKENGGLSSARNLGLDKANGKYIMFIDSDDMLEKNSLHILMNRIKSFDYDIVLGRCSRFDSLGNQRNYSGSDDSMVMTGCEALALLLEGKVLNITMCGGIYQRSCFDKLRFPIGRVCEDWYITPDVFLKADKVFYEPIAYYKYRENNASIMSGLSKKPSEDIIFVADSVIRKIKSYDDRLYLDTLWFNLRRVWKWIGICNLNRSIKENSNFIGKARELLKGYIKDLKHCKTIRFQEYVGIYSFCICPQFCFLLYKLKYRR